MPTQQTQESVNLRPQDFIWPYWPLVPLYPYGQRRTLRQEVVHNTIWTFDQLQGIFYVIVPIRMTVVKLEEGGLLVYAPVAPTPECLRLVQELVAVHGEVKYIIVPTASGLEHKVFAGPFARCFRRAQVFVVPHLWSFPLNLPLSWLGFPGGRTQVLPAKSADAPFANEFDYAILGPIHLGLGPFEEVAVFHKASHTLLVTDTVLSVPEVPPAICQLDPYPLLFHARDQAVDKVVDNDTTRRNGWQRICLFAHYFQPSALDVSGWQQIFRELAQAPDRSKRAYFGLFPVTWHPDWQRSFDRLRDNGRLLVAPILQTLVLNRGPKEVMAWVDLVARWEFQRLIPCHFDAPLEATPDQFRHAFRFLAPTDGRGAEGRSHAASFPEADLKVLRQLNQTLTHWKITRPEQV